MLHRFFQFKVQKLMVDAGFTCPNRDGSKARGGCAYCVNRSFIPRYLDSRDSIAEQIRKGKQFFKGRYPDMKYLAYFQAFTGTYARLDVLRSKYEEALNQPDVVGLVISTRPDCVGDEVLDYLASLARHTFVYIEYGIESVRDDVLQSINRQHTYADSIDAMRRTHERNLPMGAHYILGLPLSTQKVRNEYAESSQARNEYAKSTQGVDKKLTKPLLDELEAYYADEALEISKAPLQSIKIHQLQVLRGAKISHQLALCPESFPLLDQETYLNVLAVFIAHLRPDIAIDRLVSQSPPQMLIAPRWDLKPDAFALRLEEKMCEKGLYQGKYYREE